MNSSATIRSIFNPTNCTAKSFESSGRSPNHATQKALGDQPIVEFMKEEALDDLNFQGVEKQLKESFQALEIIRTFYSEGALPESSHNALKEINLTSR